MTKLSQVVWSYLLNIALIDTKIRSAKVDTIGEYLEYIEYSLIFVPTDWLAPCSDVSLL